MWRVTRWTGGPVATNGWLVGEAAAGTAWLVDAPFGIADAVLGALAADGLTLAAVILTHGHWDHVGSVDAIVRATGAPVWAHPGDADLYARPHAFGAPLPAPIPPVRVDRPLAAGDTLDFAGTPVAVLHTPGHTAGGVCLHAPAAERLFSGDTLFDGAYGRTDLPGASEGRMWESLLRLAALPAATRVHPGHGDETTIGAQTWLTQLTRASA